MIKIRHEFIVVAIYFMRLVKVSTLKSNCTVSKKLSIVIYSDVFGFFFFFLPKKKLIFFSNVNSIKFFKKFGKISQIFNINKL
jgi:hypothetical protein